MKNKGVIILLIILLFLLVIADFAFVIFFEEKNKNIEGENYDPIINPAEFSENVVHKYFTLTPRTNYVYEADTEEGSERIEIYISDEVKEIMGVKTRTVWDRVWLNGDLIEDTKDWYAQDNKGNVWYFGEDSAEIVEGKIVSFEGSWQAGVDGAKPGIIMKAEPKIGEIYRQEYYKDNAEDMAEIISLGEQVKVPYDEFNNCLKTKDWNQLEIGSEEYKYYCLEIGMVVLEVGIEDGERVELISIERNVNPSSLERDKEIQTQITKEEAKEIALKEIEGQITDMTIKRKFNQTTYVVEINQAGHEIDVIIGVNNGEILGIEE